MIQIPLKFVGILVKLYNAKEGSIADISKCAGIDCKTKKLYRYKEWLIEQRVLLPDGFCSDLFYKVNHGRIDALLLHENKDTRVLWDRAHHYFSREDFKN